MTLLLLFGSGTAPPISAALAAALNGTNPAHYHLVEVDGPDGTTYRYSLGVDYSSVATGLYKGLVSSMAPCAEAPNAPDGSISAMEWSFRLVDTSREWQQLAFGRYADTLPGSEVRAYLAHPEVARASWYRFFKGEIVRATDYPEPMVSEIRCRVQDKPLRRRVPRAEWTITRADWPRARKDLFGGESGTARAYPLIYGEQSAQNTTSTGAVPLYPVDVAGGKWLLCAGRPKSVDRVYVDGTQKTLTTHYTVGYPIVAGKSCTVITFTSGNIPAETAEVTADVKGYEATGDGSGTLITDPVARIRHILNNWILGRYLRGNWLSDDDRLDTDALDDLTFWSDRSDAGAYYQAEHVDGYEILRGWLTTHEAVGEWRLGGLLWFGVADPTEDAPSGTDADIRGDYHDVGVPVWVADDIIVTAAVKAQHLFDAASGSYYSSLTVQDASAAESELETVVFSHSDAMA